MVLDIECDSLQNNQGITTYIDTINFNTANSIYSD